jgi:O-antigen ligase
MSLSLTTLIFTTLPWLNPFSPGPTAAVGPFLFAWVCTALVGLAVTFGHLRGQAPAQTFVRAVALAWLTAACLNALIGLLQYFGATAWAGPWLNHTDFGWAYGNLRQRNQFATLLNIGLAALLWLAAGQPAPWTTPNRSANGLAAGEKPAAVRGKNNALAYLGILLLVVLLSAGNAASSSRTGLFQLALLAALALWWLHGPKRTLQHQTRSVQLVLLVALASYAVALVVLPALAGLDPAASGAWARLRAGDAPCSGRMTLWGNVLQLIAQKPWLGWGWGELDYAHFITLYPGTRFCDILDNAHNLPLQLAVEFGVPAALLVCGTGLWLLWRGQPWRDTNPTRQMAWGILAVILLHSMLEASNAQEVHDLALQMLHFSPEARVVEVLLDSARLLGRTDEVTFFSLRYQAAFPEAYARWIAKPAEK